MQMKSYVTVSFVLWSSLICFSEQADAQRKMASGFYYPVDVPDNTFHNLAVGGHFMGPDSSVVDPQTGKPGNYLSGSYHNAMDILTAYGSPVYAIADGTVTEISPGGWSNGGTTNVAVIITHITNTGQQFKTLYGHVEKAKLDPSVYVNAFVRGGQLLGRVGTWIGGNHLHFGVNLRDGSQPLPYDAAKGVGYGIISMRNWAQKFDWTDPIFFTETHCAPGIATCQITELVARSDMKQYMLGKIDNTLSTDDYNFGFSMQDQLFEYRYEWFYKQVSGQWQYFLAFQATYIPDRSVRFVAYQNWQTEQFSGWIQLYRP